MREGPNHSSAAFRYSARPWPDLALGALLACAALHAADRSETHFGMEQQITRGPGARILANTGSWSPDGQWLVYDTRSDVAGERFDGRTIEEVNVQTGEVRVLYRSQNGACCGVPIFHPRDHQAAFILGPEHPSADWQYSAWHRRGVIVRADNPGVISPLDARDIVPPFTPGALRGGSHVHVWDGAGGWISFTYEDHVLAEGPPVPSAEPREPNTRNVGIAIPGRPVHVPKNHPRNHDGGYFSVLATRTVAQPLPGSDDISRAFEEGWVGTNGYTRADGSRQRRALAFQGMVKGADGASFPEVFIVDLPEEADALTRPGTSPLEGSITLMPRPPAGVAQRRLTRTAGRKFPGICPPRHWLRSSPDGSQIAFLMRDDAAIAQLWSVAPSGGAPRQITTNAFPIASAFSWSPDGSRIAHAMDGSICVTLVRTGETLRLSPRAETEDAPRPEACVFSPDGSRIAYVRRVLEAGERCNQIFMLRTGPR